MPPPYKYLYLYFYAPDKKQLKRDKSPYYEYFKNIRADLDAYNGRFKYNEEEKNPCFNQKIVYLMQNTYFPYVGLWTMAVPVNNNNKNFKPLTTNAVESYFNKHKNVYHTDKKLYGPEYIKEHAEIVLGEVNCNLSDAITKNSIRKFRKSSVDSSSFTAKEEWNKISSGDKPG